MIAFPIIINLILLVFLKVNVANAIILASIVQISVIKLVQRVIMKIFN